MKKILVAVILASLVAFACPALAKASVTARTGRDVYVDCENCGCSYGFLENNGRCPSCGVTFNAPTDADATGADEAK